MHRWQAPGSGIAMPMKTRRALACAARLVVLPKLLADVEKVGFDLALSIVQCVREHAGFDRHVIDAKDLQA